MPIFEIAADQIRPIEQTTFSAAGVRERGDLQRLLRKQIDIIAPDILVIAEEFCQWQDSRRRIDLLALDKNANLVVIELKRTEDGGHMELQAVRYAAMVSAMTFNQVVEVYADFLQTSPAEAQTKVLEFLGREAPDEDTFAQDVRIILVSAEFSKELTSAVLWLNERDLDITCIRLRPYLDDGRVLIDVQQVIPLPEAEDYYVKIKQKEVQERQARREHTTSQQLLFQFWSELLAIAKRKTELHARVSPSKYWYLGTGAGRSGLAFAYVFGRECPRVELFINTGNGIENKRIFDQLFAAREAIDRRYGKPRFPLEWSRLDGQDTSRIHVELKGFHFRDQASWPALQEVMIENMIRLEHALRPELEKLD